MKRKALTAPLGSESGFALIGALLVMVLLTALGSAAIFQSHLDLMLAGNYRVQRTAEVAADGALELVKGMIYGNTPTINLPLTIPATADAAKNWSKVVAYSDPDIDVTCTLKYKLEDNINYYVKTPRPADRVDLVVRYGKDYNYAQAQKDQGKQPVYTAVVTDAKTDAKAEADLISTLGFRTPGAIFTRGKAKMNKHGNAAQERQEITSGMDSPGVGKPALATKLSKSSANVFIQHAKTVHGSATPNRAAAYNHNDLSHPAAAADPWGRLTSCYTHMSYTDQNDLSGYYDIPSQYYNYTTHTTGAHTTHTAGGVNPSNPLTPPWVTGALAPYQTPPPPAPVGTYYNYTTDDVYTATENNNDYVVGLRNRARDHQFILLGVGDKTKDLDAAASAATAKEIFNFDQDDPKVVEYNHVMPTPGSGTCPAGWSEIECMMGARFTDLQELADRTLPEVTPPLPPAMQINLTAQTCPNDFGGTYGCNALDMSNQTLGTDDLPQVVYINSNGNSDPATANPNTAVNLLTTIGAKMDGAGVLVINGDANIFGSINWRGLMLVRGSLFFRPWQGGNWCNRSDTSLMSTWDGFIMIGGDLDMLTLAGGTLILGYGGPNSSAAQIKGVISSAIPHKVLSWRRTYN
ncbi:MAG: pilus assembly PilX N-terminal domain-containing protein [Candidatus Methylomirabilia bacterium]